MMNSLTYSQVLSGNGVYDGSEVHETAAALAGISRAGAEAQCYAPDINQMHVIDHTKVGIQFFIVL